MHIMYGLEVILHRVTEKYEGWRKKRLGEELDKTQELDISAIRKELEKRGIA